MTNNKGYCGICADCVPKIDGGSGFKNCEEAHAAQMAEDKAMTNNQFTDELHYGDNVLWFLSELASFEPDDIDYNDFDVYGEHESGAEGTASVGIVELAADAVKLIAKLQAELQERNKFDQAKLINKFYERYPLETFNGDSERAEALGYYMAGAELQRCGEFIVYEDANCDE